MKRLTKVVPMSLEELDGLDRYLAGVEDTCRMMRKNLAVKQVSTFEGDDENSTSAVSKDGSSQSFPGDALSGIDMSARVPIKRYLEEPEKQVDRSQHSLRSSSTRSRSGYGSSLKQKKEKVIVPRGRQIRDWDQKFYQVLNGKELTGMQLFNELHTLKAIKFKGAEQQDKMYRSFRKALGRSVKKGQIRQVSDSHNAPWCWAGGALMIGYRRKNENEKPETES